MNRKDWIQTRKFRAVLIYGDESSMFFDDILIPGQKLPTVKRFLMMVIVQYIEMEMA